LQEEGFHALLLHAGEYVEQLLDEFSHETNPGLRGWLLELLAEAKDPCTFDLFLAYLHDDNEILRHWAMYGLQRLNTKEARRTLWEANL